MRRDVHFERWHQAGERADRGFGDDLRLPVDYDASDD
jgi:hypothetical protein